MGYVVAWLLYLIGVSGFLTGVWWLALRHVAAGLGGLLLALLAATLLVPWQVAGVSGYFAPAWVVMGFEALLKADGQPGPAMAALFVAWMGALGVWLLRLFARRWSKTT